MRQNRKLEKSSGFKVFNIVVKSVDFPNNYLGMLFEKSSKVNKLWEY